MLSRRFRAALRAHGLTEHQWRVLRVLSSAPEVEVAALAERVVVSGPSLSRTLKDLVARGVVARRRGDKDQRLGLLSLTSQGCALLNAAAPDVRGAAEEIERLYGAVRMKRLLGLLEDLEVALGAGVAEGHDESDPSAAPGPGAGPTSIPSA